MSRNTLIFLISIYFVIFIKYIFLFSNILQFLSNSYWNNFLQNTWQLTLYKVFRQIICFHKCYFGGCTERHWVGVQLSSLSGISLIILLVSFFVLWQNTQQIYFIGKHYFWLTFFPSSFGIPFNSTIRKNIITGCVVVKATHLPRSRRHNGRRALTPSILRSTCPAKLCPHSMVSRAFKRFHSIVLWLNV